MANATKSITLLEEDKSKIRYGLVGLTLKLLYAFLWQVRHCKTNIFLPPPFISCFLIYAGNLHPLWDAIQFLHQPVGKLDAACGQLGGKLLSRRGGLSPLQRRLPESCQRLSRRRVVRKKILFPWKWTRFLTFFRCNPSPSSPHAKWHLMSAVALADLFHMADLMHAAVSRATRKEEEEEEEEDFPNSSSALQNYRHVLTALTFASLIRLVLFPTWKINGSAVMFFDKSAQWYYFHASTDMLSIFTSSAPIMRHLKKMNYIAPLRSAKPGVQKCLCHIFLQFTPSN